MKGRIYSLDIVRGIAALSVLFSHLGNPIPDQYNFSKALESLLNFHNYFLWANGGLHWGVVTFIVLSGFCIHLPSAKRGSVEFTLASYSKRRFFRIYPIFMIAVLYGAFSLLITNNLSKEYLFNWIYNVTLISGMLPIEPPLGNGILLTVIVECLLYILYPLLILKAKNNWGMFFSAMIFIYFANFSILFFTEIEPSWLQRNIFALILYWWIGAYFAEITFNKKSNSNISIPTNLIVVLILYGIYVLFCHGVVFQGSHIFKSLYLATFIGYLLSYLCKIHKNKNELSIVKNIFVKIGESSYSLYAFHIPTIYLIDFFYIQKAKQFPEFYLINLLGVGVVTAIFFVFIEKPFHKFARNS